MRVGIFGRGKLGSVIAAEVKSQPDMELVWHADVEDVLEKLPLVDLAFDASHPDAVALHVDWASQNGVDLVIGTTGWNIPDLKERVGERCGVMVSPNFSLAVALMARLGLVLGRFATLDAEMDPYVVEHHHNKKLDAPSGTAKRLIASVMEGCPRKSAWSLNPEKPEQLSVGVIRAGYEVGHHVVGLDGPCECVELAHTARSRSVFGQGAVRAARWLHTRKGLFAFDDFASAILDPLFKMGA